MFYIMYLISLLVIFGNDLQKVYQKLKPGGIVILRDYGLYDMTQMRFINKRGRKLGENFYMRADGTRTYFFSKGILLFSLKYLLIFAIESLEGMFTQAGFVTSVVKYNTRELRNRKRRISMYRYVPIPYPNTNFLFI